MWNLKPDPHSLSLHSSNIQKRGVVSMNLNAELIHKLENTTVLMWTEGESVQSL
jgi:hypothetical protein